MRALLLLAALCVVIVIFFISCFKPGNHDQLRNQDTKNQENEKIIDMLDSGKMAAVDLTTWRLLAVYASKTGQWQDVKSILDRISGVIEHSPTLATLYLECYRSNPASDILQRLHAALNEDAVALVLHYGFLNGDFDILKLTLASFSDSTEIRLRIGQLLQVAVANGNLAAIESLNSFCFYFDREAAIQIAVHMSDLELIRALDAIDLERRWRYRLGLSAMFASYDDRNENLCWQIFQHFSLSTELYDMNQFANAIYRKWYYSNRDYGKPWYDKVIGPAPPEIIGDATKDTVSYHSNQQAFIDGIIRGHLPSVEIALSEFRQSSDLYENALIAGCVVASEQNQDEILQRLLQLTDDRTRAGIILVAGHQRNLRLLRMTIELPPIPGSRFIQAEVGRLMETAVISEDNAMFSVVLRFKDRDTTSMFGMIRAAVYAIRHGNTYWTDAMFQELSILELRLVNRLLIHIIGAALETRRYQLAFDYWRLRSNLNERSADIRRNAIRNREYTNDADRVGSVASDSYLKLGFAFMMSSIPALEQLPELLQKISQSEYDIDLQQCQTILMHLRDNSEPFWTRPARDPIRRNLFLPDYCKQRRPDLYPEFAGTPPLPLPNGWDELAKAVLMDLQDWGQNGPLLRRQTQGIPDNLRPVNT